MIDKEIQSVVSEIVGKPCCRKRIGREKSLSLGFGKQVPHLKLRAQDVFYGEWELGTYSAAWRITHRGEIIFGSSDIFDSIDEMDSQLQSIEVGALVSIESTSMFDIRITLENEMYIDFMCASSDDDEMFHVFCPEHIYLEYKFSDGWSIGKSNTPWN